MEIIKEAIIDGKKIFVGRTWTIGENTDIVIKEIFTIDEEVFIAITLSNHPNMVKIPKTNEVYESCCYINPAKMWVNENSILFDND
jgi:hypothetical protein